MVLVASLDKAKNKDADQTARMRRLVSALFFHKLPNTGFLAYIVKVEKLNWRPFFLLSVLFPIFSFL